jgi:hypothetical protein
VLRRIFTPKKDEIVGDWRKLHYKELHNLYSSPNIIRMIKPRNIRWGGMSGYYRVFVKKPEGEPVGRPRSRWEDNISVDLK